MSENYLITGYWGEPHVTSENDRGINAAIFGAGRFVLPVGEQFRAEYIGNNTVRIYDGKLIDNGAIAGIPAGEYVDLLIPEAGQGMNRNDLIVFQYSQDASTLVESGAFVVVHGDETNGTAVDPVLTHSDLLSNKATFDQMALWRVPVSGTIISAPEILYNTKFSGERTVTAHSTDGEIYTANLPGVAKLYTGLEFTIIPDKTSATTAPKLNVNGLGDVFVRRRITSNTLTTVQSGSENFLAAEQPIRVFYNGKHWIADMARPYAPDIYGVTPFENGGTGADNLKDVRANLGIVTTAWNLLDNSFFVKPVCQRGKTFTDHVDKYTIDRWKTIGKVQTGNGWLSFTNLSTDSAEVLYQYFETGTIVRGKTYTAAIMDIAGVLYVGSGTVTTNGVVVDLINDSENGFSVEIAAKYNDTDHFGIRIDNPGGVLKVWWAALYEGEYTEDTLPAYQPKGYAHELMECMRYFQIVDVYIGGLTKNGDTYYPVPFAIPMRDHPTVTVYWDVDGVQPNMVTRSGVGLEITQNVSGSGEIIWHCSADL